MGAYFITFRSVTLAQRGEVLLKKRGVRCQVQRTPRWMEEQGCGYCLRLQTMDPAVALLKGGGIPYRKVYRQREDGTVEEVTG